MGQDEGIVNKKMTEDFLRSMINAGEITIYLVNGIKLTGQILDFDDVSIKYTTTTGQQPQLVMRSAISTFVPKPKA